MAEDLGLSEEEAQAKVDQFFASKPKVEQFIKDTHAFVKKHGYVETIIGFRRNLEGINSTDFGVQSKAERQSVNTIIQGSGACLTNTALFLINQYLRNNHKRSRLAVTVHDSVLLDCPDEECPEVPQTVKYIMTHLPFKWLYSDFHGKTIRYPIDAEMDIGNNYNDMVEYNPDEVAAFGTIDNFIKYYQILGQLSDRFESKALTEEEYQAAVKKVEALHP